MRKLTMFSSLILFSLLCFSIRIYAEENAPNRLYFYKDNYFIFGSKNALPEPFEDENNQAKYQFSIKYLLNFNTGPDPEKNIINFYFIYTQKHFWNIYNTSAPFREINFSPGGMLSFNINSIYIDTIEIIPYVHESNGRDGLEDRSWNRAIVNLGWIISTHFKIALSGWHIYSFNFSEYNKDIRDYSGYFELFFNVSDNVINPKYQLDYAVRKAKKGWTNIVNIKLGLFELFAIPKSVVLHLQLYSGYLESLEDYNIKENRIRLGIGLTQ